MRTLPTRWSIAPVLALSLPLILAACGTAEQSATAAPASQAASAGAAAAPWPAPLRIVGDGFPKAGDACRIVGESAATSDFLDDSATLVGCRDAADAARLGGRQVAVIEGVTLVSVPRSATAPAAASGDGDGQGDAKVPGTEFNATAQIPCSGFRGTTPGPCEAGVKRGAGVDGGSVIEVSWPGGGGRALFFDAKQAFLTAQSNQADGSAGWTTTVTREGDRQVIRFGPERYEVRDVFLTGD